jgi:hypothetical protein
VQAADSTIRGVIDTSELPAPAQRLLGPKAPAPLKLMGARGIVPGLKPDAVVTVVCAFALGDDPELVQTAKDTLAAFPEPVLQGALASDLQGPVLELLAEFHGGDAGVVSKLLKAKNVTSLTLEAVAQAASESIGELVAASDSVLLRFPRVIEKLYLNRRVRMSTADRLVDLAVRNQLELNIPAFKQAALAIQNQLIAEPTEEPTYDDQLFQEVEKLVASTEFEAGEDTHEADDEGHEIVKDKFRPVHAQIAEMTISQKIRRATLGSAAERMILVRDSNRLVAAAVALSPMLTESEAERMAASRHVSEDVLRIISQNREFTRSYSIKLNLIGNPKTPFTFSARMIPHLRDNDLRALAKSKNVPAAIQNAARQQMDRKKGKKA